MADLGATTYTSVAWTTGDVITEAKLDNMVANDQAYDSHASQGLLLNNEKAIAGKDSGGTARNIYKINSSDEVVSGYNHTGWTEIAETVSFGSDDDPTYTVTLSGDFTGKFTNGMRIKLTDSGTQYFIITKVAEAGGTTTLTLFGGSVGDLSGGSITNPYYSVHKAPQGFSLDPDDWKIETNDSSQRTQSSPTNGTWYNLNSTSIDIPIGRWNVEFMGATRVYKSSSANVSCRISLSTTTNSETDEDFTSYSRVTAFGVATLIATPFYRQKVLDLTTKDTYYLVMQSIESSATDIMINPDGYGNTIIRATCAYL